ncbi:MAG: hypothetical protein KGS72_12135 [Cyanobacteria bacterium REEB67]|nr:hypothetical protein [Cyanobacteria bacterium REEB67]
MADPQRRHKRIKITLLLAGLALALVPGAASLRAQQYSSNRLAVGREAKVAQSNLTINLPCDLNFKSRAEIIELRRRYVYEHPELLTYQYTATPSIFEGIEDGKPWCGLEGDMFYGPGEKAILGGSEESRFLNNPFVLVAANINSTRFAFNDNKYSDVEDFIKRSGVPTYLLPSQAVIDARQCRQEVSYNVSQWLLNMEKAMETKFKLDEVPFDLVAYNARDLGYNFMQVDSRYSKGLNKTGNSPVAITQFIHCGGSCGYPGGCNNMSPFIKDLHDFHLTNLPAQAVIYLWRQRPGSSQTADFMVVLNFQ